MAPKKNLMENYDDGNLDLSLSGIQEVPVKDIAAISKATSLDLSCNIIVALPKTFATSLRQLVKLDLSQNQLSSLPENFGLLVNLKHLDLDNNKLESLPLSFGNLKSLRWLDLKRNPLMPKLAQIAGLCLDAQQCQAAARNVVAALRATQEQVSAEIARRKEEQKKKEEETLVEDNMKNQNKENHQSKKKKKKGAHAASGGGAASTHVNGQSHFINEGEDENSQKKESNLPSVPKKETTQPGFLRKVGRLVSTVVKIIIMSILLGVFCGFLLNLLDEELYMSLRKKAIGVIQSNVPKHHLKHWENGLLLTRRTVENWSGQLIAISIHYFHKSQELAATISNDETVQQYLESIKSGWHIMWIWISETYATLCLQIPHYFDSVRRIIFESSSKPS